MVEEALHIIAEFLPQEINLCLRLHTLCQHLQIEALGEVDHDFSNGPILFTLIYTLDELHINFDAVERQHFEPPQGRIFGAKIVDGDGDTQITEFLQGINCVVYIPHSHVLCNLKLQMSWVHAAFGQCLANFFHDPGIVELGCGQIDAHARGARLPATSGSGAEPFPTPIRQCG